MAKSKESTLPAVKPSPVSGDIAVANGNAGLAVAGRDEDQSLTLSRVVLYHGTPEEEELYGKHDRGTFVDALERRAVGKSIKIVPVFAFATYAVWREGEKLPVQSWKDRSQVPADLLEWTDKPGGGRQPPEAQESINVVCAVEGEPWPYLIVFKRTGLKAFDKIIKPLEARRAMTGAGHGFYELSSIGDKNPAGKPYQRLTARYVTETGGKPPEELTAIVNKVTSAQDHAQRQAEKLAADDVAAGSDEVSA